MAIHYTTLRLILGDQLNARHTWFQTKDPKTLYVIAELHQEAEYVVHHVQKVCAFFAAMEHFARGLKQAGHHVLHLNLDDTQPYKTLPDLILYLVQQHGVKTFEYQLPDEYRLRQQLSDMQPKCELDIRSYETEHFYLNEAAHQGLFSAGKRHRMEAFYRKMRKRFHILMDDDKPTGGQWNYDTNNRNKLKQEDFASVPVPLQFTNNVSQILDRIKRHKIKTIGTPTADLLWPVNRKQAQQLLMFFCEACLPRFGEFQDAMSAELDGHHEQKQWSLYHSRLSFALNTKMISPAYVVQQAVAHYEQNKSSISVSQIEGFVRQILGWREFVRGVYWANMPKYAHMNVLEASLDLPSWFWDGNTQMNCLKHAISQSLAFAYAHHIQRLMITGNFCLLAGIQPDQVDAWYLGIYIDALEWVELPNTRGMSQFADGGIVGSKAYAASGNYVKKMSDYCGSCRYKVTEITGSKACPLNALYWRFMQVNQTQLSSNPRNKMVYANWKKKPAASRQAILEHAENCLSHINQL